MAETRADEEPADLTGPERRMWSAYRTGSVCDLSTRAAAEDDPHGDRVWGPERTVRARVVALLLLHGPPPVPGRVASLKLRGVRITGRLDLSGGTVSPYVELQSCRFDSEVQLSEARFGTLRLMNCAVPRLEAARLHTEGDLHLPRCRVARGIRLTDAQIGTDLLISQAVVQRDNKGRAITADGISVAQDFQGELLETYGEVSLRGAKVGVSMNLRGARLRNPYGRFALNAPQLTVERTLYLTSIALDHVPGTNSSTPPYGLGLTPTRGQRAQRFECRGGLRVDDGRFGDAIDFYGARFVLTDEQEISLRRIQTPEFRFVGERPERGRVVVSGAKVVKLVDTATSWPGPGGVSIEGFVYENLAPRGHFPLSRRLAWVAAATPEYSPEPYERLAAVLRASGEDAEAREVLLAKQRRRRATLPPGVKAWGYLQDWTVVYGYRPGRAALWMAVLWAAGTLLFSWHGEPTAIKEDEHPQWDAALFALDLLLPVIDLGQDGQWKLSGGWQWGAATLVVLGWILATTVAAGASRLLRRG
ncbi:oxidoreductase [Streptomyces sp. NPDC051183]|uniref:oxidoreductase n=1 Tax=unclassified Streptomyces TaxID=2593676 RepID=UPI00342081CC